MMQRKKSIKPDNMMVEAMRKSYNFPFHRPKENYLRNTKVLKQWVKMVEEDMISPKGHKVIEVDFSITKKKDAGVKR